MASSLVAVTSHIWTGVRGIVRFFGGRAGVRGGRVKVGVERGAVVGCLWRAEV